MHNTGRQNMRFCTGRYSPILFCTPAQTRTLLDEHRVLVLLIRHGTTDWNLETRLQGREEVPLNDKGREQARLCAGGLFKALEGLPVKGFYTSPLSRAYETAKTVSEHFGAGKPVTVDGLIERDYGSITGMTFAARRELFRSADGYPEDMENTADTAVRMKRTVASILSEPGDGIPILFTHGGILNSFFSVITRGRAGSGGNIVANCTVEMIAAGKNDTIPIAFNLRNGELFDFIKELYK